MKLPLIKGWDLSSEKFEIAWKEGALLTASIETSNICNLACDYCFREENSIVSKKRLQNEVLLEDSLNIIDDLAKLGVKTINIAGAGELLLDPNLPRMLERIYSHGITSLVATNGSKINDYWINCFIKTGTSVMIKVNSFNEQKQNQLVNRTDYAKKRDRGLKKLIEAGFNKATREYQTRLSINALVSKDTIDEIPEIFNYCRGNNIMPCMASFIPAGKTANRTDNEVSKKDFLVLADRIRIQDKERGIEYMRLWPYLGGVPCTQQGKASIFVNILGGIYDCPAGTINYGDLKTTTIENAFNRIKAEQTNYCFGCLARDLR